MARSISLVGSQWAERFDLLVGVLAVNERQSSEGEGKIAWLRHGVKHVKLLMTNRAFFFFTLCA